MSHPNPKDLETLLETLANVEPPADLLGRLEADVPPALHVVRETAPTPQSARPFRRTAVLMAALGLAAMLVIGVAIGVLRLPSGPTTPIQGDARPTPVPVPTAPPPVATVPPVAEAPTLPARTAPPEPVVPSPTAIVAAPVAPAPSPAAAIPDAAGVATRTLEVVVADRTGAPLPGVSATLSSPVLQGSRIAVTDADGKASFPRLPEGRYDLEARLDGFTTVDTQGVALPEQGRGRVEVTLEPASFEEGITVSAENVVVDTSGLSANTKLAPQDLQYYSHRSYSSVVQMAPQSSAQSIGQARPKATAAPGQGAGALDSSGSGTTRAVDRFPTSPSTGGSKEPNGRLHGDVFFEHAGVNPFVDTDDDPRSTFALDVDTASYTIARRLLGDGQLPPKDAVRVEEFVNFFDTAQAPPARGDFAIRLEAAPTPFASGDRYRLLAIGIRARDMAFSTARPVVLTVVLDTSGSMQGARLQLAKDALALMLAKLRPGDRVGLVQFNTSAAVVSTPTGDLPALRRTLESLQAGGSTNASAGLRLGYDLAEQAFDVTATNRVMLLSDGVANEGLTDADTILGRIVNSAGKGIELTTVGVGMGNYNDVLLEKLADKGDGRYAYVDTLEEARRIFVENLTGTLQTIGADAKVQVEFNPRAVASYRLLGYENRDVADRDFRNDEVDGGEVGVGHHVTALYEVKLQPEVSPWRHLATVRLRYRPVDRKVAEEIERSLRVADLARRWEDASPTFRLAAVAAEFAEILRGSYWAKGSTLVALASRADDVATELSDRPEVRELADLVAAAARLQAENDEAARPPE